MRRDEARARDAADPLSDRRAAFALPDGLTYLDGNSLGALPRAVPDAVADTVTREWGADLITSWNRAGWIDWPVTIGAMIAPLVGGHADEVLVCDSTSVNLAKLAGAALRHQSPRRVIVTEEGNFPTDLYMLAASGAEVRRVPRSALVEALDEDVALLALTHVDYRTGERHDLAALSAAARAVGALSLWDLAHSAGAIRCDLGAARADLAIGCGYKYLNGGPGAPAWLYVRRELQDELHNPLPGWLGHAAPFAFEEEYRPAPGLRRFLTGTPSIVAMAALRAALAAFEGIDPAVLDAKAGALGDAFIAAVEARCPDVTLASPRDAARRGAQVSVRHPDGYRVMQALIARGVIGDFRAPDLIRFGFAPMTTRFVDVVTAADTLAEVLEDGGYRTLPGPEGRVT